MTFDPTRLSAAGIDLSPRARHTAVVSASPADDAETVIASLSIPGNLPTTLGCLLFGWVAFTVGASGTAVTVRIRKSTVAGTVVAATGAVTFTAADLGALAVQGLDATPALPNQVYVVTLEVADGAAESTVSGVDLVALVV